MRTLVAIPVYNEQRHIARVIPRVLEHAPDVLVVDDGSTDETPMLLAKHPVEVARHARNRGYGRSLRDAFRWAMCYRFDWIVTMDCDEQHEPDSIPEFLDAAERGDADIISGSRYLEKTRCGDGPPPDRRRINEQITDELNARLELSITDAFCGFKAYRVEALRCLELREDGYAMPLELWVEAVVAELRVHEIPVRLIYNDPSRSFGGPLDDPETRLDHYRRALHCAIERREDALPESARTEIMRGCCG